MNKNIIFGFFVFIYIFIPCAEAENVTVYIIPSISDNKLLPMSSIPSSYISDNISIKGSPDEFEPSSFVIHANQDINSIVVETTNLSGNEGIISKEYIDIRIVKCWYQGNYRKFGGLTASGKYFTPELLLKDDSLIKVTGENWTNYDVSNPKGNNHLKLINGSFINISNNKPKDWVSSTSNFSFKDAATLQPVTIQKGCNKQFWITIYIPHNANAGNYSGTIRLKKGSRVIKELYLNLQVLPIALSKPNVEYSIYYRGVLTANGSTSSEEKTVEQYTIEMQNIFDHGVTNPVIYGQIEKAKVQQMLKIRQNIGINNKNLYFLGLGINNSAGWISGYKNYVKLYGVEDLYVYAPDEQDLNDSITRSKIAIIQEAGCKVMAAQSLAQATSIADVIDLAVVSKSPNIDLANIFHKHNHKIYSYANPQVVPEYPRLFRMNYGLLLWQRNYDGAMDYAYQHSFGSIWNDFDSIDYRDHVFAYPTTNGVIDTIQWEGFREGVDDMRYLATLQDTIRLAKIQEKDTLAAENYLASLKNSDLSSQDLDEIRGQIINYTLSLQNQLNSTGLSDDKQNKQYYLVASFTANKVYGKVPLSITFKDTSKGFPTLWNWSFGDGTYSTVQNPRHTYSKAGNYTVILTISNSTVCNTTKFNYIEVKNDIQKPIIYFWGSRVSGTAPLSVRFTDASTESPTAWNWNFGDGTYSTVQNPRHTYSKAGNYTVILTASNEVGNGTKIRANYVKVIIPITQKLPVVTFWGSRVLGTVPLTVYFTDNSTGSPTKWNWNFGDGTYSTAQNPKHTYSRAGNYTVTLVATNSTGSGIKTRYHYINVR